MADMNNFGDIQESFVYITEALDSIRAQNAMNLGNMDKVLVNINGQLEDLTKEAKSDLLKVFLLELKRSLDERHDFVSTKFVEIEESFHNIIQKTDKQLTGSEVKELFEIIATNLSVFSKDFTTQKQLISEIGFRIEDLQKDDSQTKEILKNISVLKIETEKFGNGFESIILNLNDNFGKLSLVLKGLDTKDALASIKKDIENIFLSTNAILSTQQVIDHKNRELEATINTFVTKEDFNVEREQVAKLIAQNIELTNYINNLPTHNQFNTLTEKIDTSIGVIHALKNMLSETGKQNQKMLTAQLENLETKILNISTEEEFIGFRKELSEFAKQVMDNTNLIRADLADTNSALQNMYEFLNTIDIKNSFLNFTQITKNSENSIKDSMSNISKSMLEEVAKNKNYTRADIENATTQINSNIQKTKNELDENAKSNLSTVLEHIQSVVSNLFTVKNELQIDSSENLEAIDEKINVLKEELVSTSNFVVENAQENLETLLSNVEKIAAEMSTLKDSVSSVSLENSEGLIHNFSDITRQLQEIRSDLTNNSKEGFSYVSSLIEDFAGKLASVKDELSKTEQENATEVKETLGGLSLKLNALQEITRSGYDVNFAELKGLLEELTNITNSAKTSLEQSSKYEILGLRANIEDLSQKLSDVEQNIDSKSQSNLEKIASLFVELSTEFASYKEFLNDSAQANFQSVSLCVQNLNQRIEESKNLFNDELTAGIYELKNVITAIPETIKENQVVFENEKRNLIEENSKNIQIINEKIQNLIKGILSKDNPFKEEVIFEFSNLKSNLEIVKEELLRSNHEIDDNLTNQIAEFVENVEKSINSYDEKTNQAFFALNSSLGEYFNSVKEINLQSNNKLEESLREIFEVKSEISDLMNKLSDLSSRSGLIDLSGEINQRFDGLLVDMAQLEEKFSTESADGLRSTLANMDEKFESVYGMLRDVKSQSGGKAQEVIAEIIDKTETVKSQLNLVSTDIINILSGRSGEILSRIDVLNEQLVKLSEVSYDGYFSEIKDKLDSGYSQITSVIKQEFNTGNEEQLDKLSVDFSNVNEKLDKILFRVASDNTKEIVELKSILTEKVDNITSINNVLEIVLNRLEEISSSNVSNKEIILNTKEVLIDKLNIMEGSLIHSQGESRAELFDKISEVQNRTTTSVLAKIGESQNQTQLALHNINEGLSNVGQDLYSSSEQAFSGLKNEIFEKMGSFEDTILQTHYSTRTAILDKLSAVQNNSKNEMVAELKENLGSKIDEFYSSTQDLFSEIKYNLVEKVSTLEESLHTSQENSKEAVLDKISETQDRNRNELLYGLKQNITEVTDELYSSVQASLSGVKSDVLNKINYLEESFNQSKDDADSALIEKLEQTNENVKNSVLDRISEVQTELSKIKNNTAGDILFGVKESIISSIEEFNSTTRELLNSVSTNVFEKLDSIAEFIKENSESANSKIESQLSEMKAEVKQAVLNGVYASKHEVLETQEQNKINIITELKDAVSLSEREVTSTIRNSLAENNDAVLDKISEINETLTGYQQDSQSEFVDKLIDNQLDLKDTLVDKISDIQYEISSSQEKSKQELLYGVKEALAMSADDFCVSAKDAFVDVQGDIVNKIVSVERNLYQVKDEVKTSVENTISEILTDSNDKLAQDISNAKVEITSRVSEQVEDMVSEVADRAVESVLEAKNEIKTDVLERVEALQSEAKATIIEKLSDVQQDLVAEQERAKQELLYGVKENLSTVSDDFCVSAKEAFADVKDDIIKKVDSVDINLAVIKEEIKTSVNEKVTDILVESSEKTAQDILNSQEDLTSAISTKISNAVSEITEKTAENILNSQDEVTSSVSEKLSDVVSEITEKNAENILNSQNELISSVAGKLSDLVLEISDKTAENFAETKEEITKVISGKVSDIVFDSNSKIEESILDARMDIKNAVVEKLVDNQTEVKDAIVEKITDVNDTLVAAQEQFKQEVILGVKENLSFAVDDFGQAAKEAFSDVKSEVIDKVEMIEEQLSQSTDEVKTVLADKVSEALTETSEKIAQDLVNAQEDIKAELAQKLGETVEDVNDKVAEIILDVKEDIKTSVADEISKSQNQTELAILNELQENNNLVKEVLEALAEDENAEEEAAQKAEELETLIKSISENIETKIDSVQEEQKTQTQALLSDVKLSFYEKVDDGLDGLKSFLEVLQEEKGDISPLLDEVKAELLDKFLDVADKLEESIGSVSVKAELEELNGQIQSSVDELFGKIQEEFVSSLENSSVLTDISEKATVIDERVETVKQNILDDLSEKFAQIEVQFTNQKADIAAVGEEIKNALNELKENYIDLSINSSMEISGLLMGFQEKFDEIQEKLNGIDLSDINISSELEQFDFNNAISESKEELSDKISEVTEKIDELAKTVEAQAENILTESSINEIKLEIEALGKKLEELKDSEPASEDSNKVLEEIEAVSQKLDLLAAMSETDASDDLSEIKEILTSQESLIKKLDKLDDLESLFDSSELVGVKEEIQSSIKSFEEKVESLIESKVSSPELVSDNFDSSSIEGQLNSFKDELVESLVEFFNQISFVAEAEEIKDFVDEKTNEIRAEINSKLGIQNDINEIKNQLMSLQLNAPVSAPVADDSDYSYTLQDVETDIAKLRLVLKEISEKKTETVMPQATNVDLSGLDQLSADITSISTRTNKLLLNSDESYSALKTNLEDLKGVIYQFDNKVKYLDNKEHISKIEKKLENINNLVLSSVQSDKIFNQTFMYLAEWIDKADDNINQIKQNMIKTTDMEKLLDKFSKKFDKQEEKIKSLEAKIEKLTKAKPAKETDVRSIVTEVLSKIEKSESKPDTKLIKKVDGIDRQLATLGKSIEKITSYVD